MSLVLVGMAAIEPTIRILQGRQEQQRHERLDAPPSLWGVVESDETFVL